MKRYVKNGGAQRRRFLAIREKPVGVVKMTPHPPGRKLIKKKVMRYAYQIEITHERGTREEDWADWRWAAVLHKLTSYPSSARVRRTYSHHPQTTETIQYNLYGGPKTALFSGVGRKNSNFQFDFEKQVHPVACRQLPEFWPFFVVDNVPMY